MWTKAKNIGDQVTRDPRGEMEGNYIVSSVLMKVLMQRYGAAQFCFFVLARCMLVMIFRLQLSTGWRGRKHLLQSGPAHAADFRVPIHPDSDRLPRRTGSIVVLVGYKLLIFSVSPGSDGDRHSSIRSPRRFRYAGRWVAWPWVVLEWSLRCESWVRSWMLVELQVESREEMVGVHQYVWFEVRPLLPSTRYVTSSEVSEERSLGAVLDMSGKGGSGLSGTMPPRLLRRDFLWHVLKRWVGRRNGGVGGPLFLVGTGFRFRGSWATFRHGSRSASAWASRGSRSNPVVDGAVFRRTGDAIPGRIPMAS